MELNAKTKIDDLLKQYPFLLDFLITLSPHFENLKNPLIRKTMGKVATLKQAADIGGLDIEGLISALTVEIDKQTVTDAGSDKSAPAAMDETPTDSVEKQEILKGIIRDLHDGEDMEALKERFRELSQGVEATEIAKMEQALMDEGLPAEEIKRLCDVHVEIFKEALEEQDRPESPLGHPIHTFMKENRASEKIMSDTSMLMGSAWDSRPALRPLKNTVRRWANSSSKGCPKWTPITHAKKTSSFPMLEAHHFTGPSQVMWSIHDDIRANMKQAREAFGRK